MPRHEIYIMLNEMGQVQSMLPNSLHSTTYDVTLSSFKSNPTVNLKQRHNESG